jgi:hypothetical protein
MLSRGQNFIKDILNMCKITLSHDIFPFERKDILKSKQLRAIYLIKRSVYIKGTFK